MLVRIEFKKKSYATVSISFVCTHFDDLKSDVCKLNSGKLIAWKCDFYLG